MNKLVRRWQSVSGAISIVVAIGSYFMCKHLVLSGEYAEAVYAMYAGVLLAVAGIGSMAFSHVNKEAMTLVFYMYLSLALGAVLVVALSLWSMVHIVVWSFVCSVTSYCVMKDCK